MGPPDRLDAKEAPLIARIWVMLVLGASGGCSALDFTQAECSSMNWYERGERDGFGGHPPQIIRLAQQCARHGVVAGEADYRKGWAVGHDEHDRLKTMKDD